MAKPLAIELPANLDTPFAVPEGATVAEIEATLDRIRKDADALLDDTKRHDAPATERIARAEWLIGAMDALTGRKTEIVAEQQAEADKVAEIRSRLGGTKDDDQGDDDQGDDEDGGQGNDGGDTGVVQAGDLADQAPAEPVLVASAQSVRRSAIADAARRKRNPQHQPRPVKAREAYLVAAAESDGFSAGTKIDWSGAGSIAEKKFNSLPSPMHGGGGRVQLGIGQMKMDVDEQLVASARRGSDVVDEDSLARAIEWALSGERLKRETGEDSLVAAGGWCAPSETLYDLVDLTTADGLVDLPGITVNRGGVRFALGPDFTAVYNAGANFTKTEAQAIAGSTKPVVNIPCPSFTDNRMVVDGMYFTGDILSAKGYPEAYADFLQKAGKAFQHYVNAQSINAMVAASTAVDLTESGTPPPYANSAVSTELLGAVELQLMDMRYKNRLGMSQGVELVLPFWLLGALRSDFAKRVGVDNTANISNADIEQFFSARGGNVQYVYDWQDGFTGGTNGATFGGATPPAAWPTQAQFLMYPQGTFVRALSDVIELNAVYDSTLLATNQYVALFMEQARLVLKRAWDARAVTVPVAVSGAMGAGVDYTTKQPTV